MEIPDDERIEQEDEPQANWPRKSSGLNEWLLVVTLVLIAGVVVAVGYMIHAQDSEQRLAAANGKLAAELTQTKSQVSALSARLSGLSVPIAQPAPPADETLVRQARSERTASSVRRRHARAVPSKWQKQMQGQLTADQQRIAADEQALAKTQADMASNADSTRNNLNDLGGSVARDHAELVALEKRGQRNYYEFDLFKSKRFAREGPISLELRHTNTKRGNYDVVLLVNDSKLAKKHVNLYEPVVLDTDASPQPLEMVVNRIDKNHIHGYVSAPKSYSERASAATGPATPQFSLTPVPAQDAAQASAAGTPATATPTAVTPASAELTANKQQ